MAKKPKAPKAPPKTNRERKADFDRRTKNRGGVDPAKPERWATVFYLTRESVDLVARIREEARFEGTQHSRNAALFDEMVQVYSEWLNDAARSGASDQASLGSTGAPIPPFSAQLAKFSQSIEALRELLVNEEDFEIGVMDAHLKERCLSFDAMFQRLSGLSTTSPEAALLRNEWHREIEDYLTLLFDMTAGFFDGQLQVPPWRGYLFRRVLRRLQL